MELNKSLQYKTNKKHEQQHVFTETGSCMVILDNALISLSAVFTETQKIRTAFHDSWFHASEGHIGF